MKCDQCKKEMSARDTVKELLSQYIEQLYLCDSTKVSSEIRAAAKEASKHTAKNMLDFVEKLSPRKPTECDMTGHY